VTAGITALLNLLIGAGGTAFNNANAYLGIGDSTTAAAIGQTDLQAASNKVRQAMDSTYPQVSGNVVTFRATFGTGAGNFSIQEQGTFNASGGRHDAQSQGERPWHQDQRQHLAADDDDHD
jgi:hypothetical protein